jgi:hypothetical protein
MLQVAPTFLAANTLVRKEPVFIFTIETYGRVFSNKPGYGDNDWIVNISDLRYRQVFRPV